MSIEKLKDQAKVKQNRYIKGEFITKVIYIFDDNSLDKFINQVRKEQKK